MIPAGLVAGQRRSQQSLRTLANRDLLTVWRSLDLADARTATGVLIPTVRDLTGAYGNLAGTSAADFYDDARAASGQTGRYTARPAGPIPAGQADALTRWAVTPMWAATPRPDVALARLVGGLARHVVRPARETVEANARRERVRWVVVPSADACEWCLMLASRGDVYRSQQTGRVSIEAGREYHDSCRCVVQPAWSDDDVPQVNRDLEAEWQEHASAAPDPRAAWRRHIAATRTSVPA